MSSFEPEVSQHRFDLRKPITSVWLTCWCIYGQLQNPRRFQSKTFNLGRLSAWRGRIPARCLRLSVCRQDAVSSPLAEAELASSPSATSVSSGFGGWSLAEDFELSGWRSPSARCACTLKIVSITKGYEEAIVSLLLKVQAPEP